MPRKQRKHSEILWTRSDFNGGKCSLLQLLTTRKVCVITLRLWKVKSNQSIRSSECVQDSAPSLSYLCFAFTVVSAALQSCVKEKRILMTFKIIPPCYFVRLLALSCDFLPCNWPIIIVFVCFLSLKTCFLSLSPAAVSQQKRSRTVDSDKTDT